MLFKCRVVTQQATMCFPESRVFSFSSHLENIKTIKEVSGFYGGYLKFCCMYFGTSPPNQVQALLSSLALGKAFSPLVLFENLSTEDFVRVCFATKLALQDCKIIREEDRGREYFRTITDVKYMPILDWPF